MTAPTFTIATTEADESRWFPILADALHRYALPDGRRNYRIADPGEFMLMQVSPKEARFKHRQSRDYLHVHDDGRVVTYGRVGFPA